ncbi:MAG TPA: hypothetical protein VLZ10_01245 [Thermodesulfobacteriota bacterium]|nr:hypothetical protein [Thermodesulfobacteriota bacterium]
MKYRLWAVSLSVIFFFPALSLETIAQGKREGQVNWTDGYVSAIGEGTATPSGNKAKDQLRAVRAATLLAQRALLEAVKELKIDSQTKVENKMAQEDIVNTRIEGTIRGAEITRQNVRWEGETPIATVQMRMCLGGIGACKSEGSIINTLALDQKNEPPDVPQQRLDDVVSKSETVIPKTQDIFYDSSKPVTGIIFNLQGLFFERVILPVVITIADGNRPLTVYSAKSVEPQIFRTYGIVRYADSIDQARQNPHLGDNTMIIPVTAVTKENLIVIGLDAARLIRETTSHGNNYLKNAKVTITAQ